MCDDVPAFTDASVTLVIGIVKKFFMMIGFSGALFSVRLLVQAKESCLSGVDVMLNTPLPSRSVAAEVEYGQSACDVAFPSSVCSDMQLEGSAVPGVYEVCQLADGRTQALATAWVIIWPGLRGFYCRCFVDGGA